MQGSRKLMEKILRLLSILVLKKYKPEIIGVTGSFGKTSAKEAIYSVLNSKFKVNSHTLTAPDFTTSTVFSDSNITHFKTFRAIY